MTAPSEQDDHFSPARFVAVIALVATCLWVYWTSLGEIADIWSRRPEYSHGWMVPAFAIFLLWHRRRELVDGAAHRERIGFWGLLLGALAWLGPWLFEASGTAWQAVQAVGLLATVGGFSLLIVSWLRDVRIRPSWWGLPLLLAAIALRWYAASVYLEWIDFVSLIPFVLGLVWLCGGTTILKWSWMAICFLFFMIPLPFTLEVMLRDPLRRAGTLASTYAMQTIGLPAFAEGNVVTVNNVGIDVVEACSGLRMMMVFFALSVGLAVILDRPMWQRLFVAASAIPIALIANTARITITGLLYVWGYDQLADDFFHDFAGWLMPVLAVGLLQVELWYLDHLFIVDEKKPLNFGMGAYELREPAAD